MKFQFMKDQNFIVKESILCMHMKFNLFKPSKESISGKNFVTNYKEQSSCVLYIYFQNVLY